MMMNKTIWRQADSRWGSKPYPTKDCTMSGAGCGCVACTHVAMEQDRYANWTPEALRPWMVSQGFAIRNQGTTYSGITKTLQHIGHSNVTVVGTADPMSKVWAECNKGNRIGIILFRGGSYNGVRWTNSGHYVAFTDYKVSGGKHYFYCKDSGGRGHNGFFAYENSMKGLVYMVWIVQRVNKQSETPDPNKALSVDGVGGEATVTKLQNFLGVKLDGVITIAKSSHKYCKALVAVEYGSGGSTTVKAMQKWLGINQDGDWGPATSKALQKKLGVTQDGYFGSNSMKALQRYLNANKKAVYPELSRWDKANAYARRIAADNSYHYVSYGSKTYTHECPICTGRTDDKGWNCIGFAWSVWRHGAGIPCRCNCEVINDPTADKILRSNHETAVEIVKAKTGLTQVTVVSNGGKAIPLSSLRKGDIVLLYDGKSYYHTEYYMGDGKFADCTQTRSDNIKADVTMSKAQQADIKIAIRYTGK